MTIEQKALELVNAASGREWTAFSHADSWTLSQALCRAIEAHEADKARHAAELREQAERFSEAARTLCNEYSKGSITRATIEQHLTPFILPAADPLARVIMLCDEDCSETWAREMADRLRTHGVTMPIVKKEAVNG